MKYDWLLDIFAGDVDSLLIGQNIISVRMQFFRQKAVKIV